MILQKLLPFSVIGQTTKAAVIVKNKYFYKTAKVSTFELSLNWP